MKIIRALIKRYPVLTYYGVVFTISWGGILLVVGPGGFPATKDQVETLMPLVLLALFAGPSIGGVLLTGLVHGRTGFRDLLARMTRWRVGTRWYAVALLTGPLLVTVILLTLSIVSPEYLPRILTADNKVALLLFGIGWGLAGGGLLEELGWTGFAVPQLRLHHGILSTGLIVGFLWGAWHYLVAFWTISGITLGGISPGIFLPALVFYVGSLPAYRVLMVWVNDRTESLLVAILMHASLSASALIMEPLELAVVPGLTYGLMLAAALWVAVGVVAVANQGHLSRRPLLRKVA